MRQHQTFAPSPAYERRRGGRSPGKPAMARRSAGRGIGSRRWAARFRGAGQNPDI